MIPISKPLIEEEEINAVVEVLKSGMIAQGPKVAELEEMFAKLCGTKYAVATTNGTTVIHASLVALGIKEGDRGDYSSFYIHATRKSDSYGGW